MYIYMYINMYIYICIYIYMYIYIYIETPDDFMIWFQNWLPHAGRARQKTGDPLHRRRFFQEMALGCGDVAIFWGFRTPQPMRC